MENTTWFRDMDSRDAELAARARAGDVDALAELRHAYWELGADWARTSGCKDPDALVREVDHALVGVVIRERPRVLHDRWLGLIRAESQRQRAGLTRTWRAAGSPYRGAPRQSR